VSEDLTLRSSDSSVQPSGGSGSDSCTQPAFFCAHQIEVGQAPSRGQRQQKERQEDRVCLSGLLLLVEG
jgi:hypothetical protein